MCDPVSLAGLAIGAVSQVAGYMGAKNEASAQNQLAANNRIEANRAAADQYAATQNRMLQEQAAAGRDVEQADMTSAKARGTAQVTSGEAGISGMTVDSLIADYNAQQGKFERTTAQNLEMTQQQLRDNMDGVKAQTTSRINSVQKAAKPSFLPYAIGIASSGLDAYSTHIKKKGN